MVNLKNIIIFVLVAVVGVFAAFYFFQSEESKVKKKFNLLSELGSREPGENKLALTVKNKQFKGLFTENCAIEFPAYSISKTFPAQEFARIVFGVLLQYSEYSPRFYDIGIQIPSENSANAVFTAKLTGKLPSGEYVQDIHEVESTLSKIDGEWLFSGFEVVDVLEK